MGNVTRRRRLGSDIVSAGMQQVDKRFSVEGVEIANLTTFVSAEVLVSSGGNHINVTLSDDKGYASVSTEWYWNKNGGTDIVATGANGGGTSTFLIGVGPNGTIVAGDVITISHPIEDSGIVRFISKPVLNSLV